jgi:hypothetical protein
LRKKTADPSDRRFWELFVRFKEFVNNRRDSRADQRTDDKYP